MSSFQHIRHLDIVKVEFNTFIDFVQLVRSFPVLETLSVSLLQWQPSILKIDYSAYQLRRPIRMRLVDLLEKSAADVAHWLLAHNPTPRIDTLHFETNKPESNKIMHQLIMACGPSINELKFELAFASETEAHLEDSIGIRNCVNLQHLHLHNIILFSGYPMTGAITRRVPVLLSQVTSTQIREVVFTVLICQKEHLDLLNWESVTEILSGPRFANLMTVRVRVPGSVVTFDRAEVARQLREDKLSVFHGRGMVVLEFPGALGAY
ncbi:hypothetical protein BDQ12DRAFT_721346 [Crucibulum laeve]|uniref:F-box domain-containing protein n=1 Tax=Crucibulum laeve TaxID=68775 RepID=A0A5C3M788_9AGAR|nr:hypothetical protein BDQ12DRAFT_721346 [Crucibulum laeve]